MGRGGVPEKTPRVTFSESRRERRGGGKEKSEINQGVYELGSSAGRKEVHAESL